MGEQLFFDAAPPAASLVSDAGQAAHVPSQAEPNTHDDDAETVGDILK